VRGKFEASDDEPIVVRLGAPAYLKALGSQNRVALVQVSVLPEAGGSAVCVWDPLLDVLYVNRERVKVQSLAQFGGTLSSGQQIHEFAHLANGAPVPLFAITAVDMDGPSITIQLDRDVEKFEPTVKERDAEPTVMIEIQPGEDPLGD
jgi:hypothetical protein